jgi:hypothetical protein
MNTIKKGESFLLSLLSIKQKVIIKCYVKTNRTKPFNFGYSKR